MLKNLISGVTDLHPSVQYICNYSQSERGCINQRTNFILLGHQKNISWHKTKPVYTAWAVGDLENLGSILQKTKIVWQWKKNQWVELMQNRNELKTNEDQWYKCISSCNMHAVQFEHSFIAPWCTFLVLQRIISIYDLYKLYISYKERRHLTI